MYASGQGTEADDAQAVFWYQKAVVKGHAVAECNLGNCYHDGRGVAKDLAVAFKWCARCSTTFIPTPLCACMCCVS
jgi:TPR repeat protein